MAQIIFALLLIALAIWALKAAIALLLIAGLIFRTKETLGLIVVLGLFVLLRDYPVACAIIGGVAVVIALARRRSGTTDKALDDADT